MFESIEIHFKIIGVLLIGLAFLHFFLPRYFNWKEELPRLSLANRQIFKIHTFFIALVVFLIGVLCYFTSHDLASTRLGKNISLGLAIFWSIRLFIQFFGYSQKLWKGKLFETIVHVVSSLFWLYLSLVFWMNYIN